MRHTELVNNIKGSFLKTQYMEAFLLQSAYTESLLKLFVEYSYWEATKDKLSNSPLLAVLSQNFNKFNLRELISFLYKSKLITKEHHQMLEEYREKRDALMQELVKETSKEIFEKDLRDICEQGNILIESKEFKHMATIVDYMEKSRDRKTNPEAPKNGNASLPPSMRREERERDETDDDDEDKND